MKVSFDFDSTLSVEVVAKYAKKLIEEGHIVWIVTSRHEFADKSGNAVNNSDLCEVAETVGIPKERIFFTNYADKSEFLKDKGFLWHLDDDILELAGIRYHTDVFPIWRQKDNDWYNQCNDLIRILSKKYESKK